MAFAVTGEREHGTRARLAFDWFLGRNHLNRPLYDFATGGCSDGLGDEDDEPQRRGRVDARLPSRGTAPRRIRSLIGPFDAGRRGLRVSKRELFERHAGNPILTSADWPYPVNAVFNPAAAVVGDQTLILARVEDLRGISHLTVARSSNGVDGWTIDPEPLLAPIEGIESEEWGFEDPRVVWIPELGRWTITCTVVRPARTCCLPGADRRLPHRRPPRRDQGR